MVRNNLTLPTVHYHGASYSTEGKILDTFEAQKIGPVETFLIEQLNKDIADFVAIWKNGNGTTRKIIIQNKVYKK